MVVPTSTNHNLLHLTFTLYIDFRKREDTICTYIKLVSNGLPAYICDRNTIVYSNVFEPLFQKSNTLHNYAKPKAKINCAVSAQLISAFGCATRVVQFLFDLFRSLKLLACSCDCTAWSVSDCDGSPDFHWCEL